METVLQTQGGSGTQLFYGFEEHRAEPPFEPSLMVKFRKQMTLEMNMERI